MNSEISQHPAVAEALAKYSRCREALDRDDTRRAELRAKADAAADQLRETLTKQALEEATAAEVAKARDKATEATSAADSFEAELEPRRAALAVLSERLTEAREVAGEEVLDAWKGKHAAALQRFSFKLAEAEAARQELERIEQRFEAVPGFLAEYAQRFRIENIALQGRELRLTKGHAGSITQRAADFVAEHAITTTQMDEVSV